MDDLVGIRADGADVLLQVKVVPGASRTRLAGFVGDRLKITVAAPPEKGKANAALTDFLAKLCHVRKRDVVIEAGQTSPTKTVRIRGIEIDGARQALSLQ